MRRVGEEEVEVGEEDKNEPIWALRLCFFLVFDFLLTPGCRYGNEKWRANVSQCTSVSSAVSGTSLSNAIEQSSRMFGGTKETDGGTQRRTGGTKRRTGPGGIVGRKAVKQGGNGETNEG